MDRGPLPLSEFSVNLRKHVDPTSPVPLRMMAAKSLVPMAPQEMALVLYQLGLDTNTTVRDTAQKTFRGTPLDLLRTAFTATVPPAVLDWAADLFEARDEVLELVVTNPQVHDSTVERVAKQSSAALSDLIAENQVRLLRAPQVIEALYMNPEARMSTVDKLVDLARRNGVMLEGLPALRPLLESKEPIVEPATVAPQSGPVVEEADAMFGQFLSQALFDEDVEAEQGDREEGDEASERHQLARARQHYLTTLRVPQKIRFAILGSREDRAYLIRDPNRMVHLAAVSSPKATEHDALNWSSSKMLPEAVVEYIASRRDWIRNYLVKVNLVNNPKVPLRTALRLLPHLHPRDLATLARNRNVSAQLQRQARALGLQRQAGPKGR
jgi:hypothetical protein